MQGLLHNISTIFCVVNLFLDIIQFCQIYQITIVFLQVAKKLRSTNSILLQSSCVVVVEYAADFCSAVCSTFCSLPCMTVSELEIPFLWCDINSTLFSSNHNIHKSLARICFGAPGLQPKNKGHPNFYEFCDLTKKCRIDIPLQKWKL